ncbi:hypothetical protein [Nitrosopumilus sp.]|uniref:hypothetical protein n=1 Tax=Nitrosopumilus sp. TaxID=2024843 RepID=UPI003D12811F
MVQEAHAVTGFTAQTTSTTQITITWDVTNMDTGSIADTDFEITLDDTTVITSANFNVAFSDGTGAGGNDQTVITLTANTMPTDDTPDVELLVGQSVTSGTGAVTLNGAVNAESTDGVSPVVSSATVTSSTTISITFSEDIVDTASDLDDYTINGVTGGSDISAKSVTGAVLTLTTNGYSILSSETVTVTFDGEANELEDTGTLNDVADFTNQSVSNGLSPETSNGSGCDGDCEEPTLGVLPDGQRIVEDGFTYNGHSVDVERFFTPYPLITAQVGKQNTAQFKIYENNGPDNIAHFSFAFGLGKGEIISQSKAMIEVDFARDRTQTITITDPENALDNVSVTTDKVSCNGGPTPCLEITINHMFREPLDFNIVGTDVWDYSRQSWQNYYNHGIEVVGESLNPPNEYNGIDKGHIYHLTETSKTTAVDEFGDSWTFQYGKWHKDFIKNKQPDSDTDVMTRTHSDFEALKEIEHNKAMEKLEVICPHCKEHFADFKEPESYAFSIVTLNKLNTPEIKNKLIWEENKAQNIINSIMNPEFLYK